MDREKAGVNNKNKWKFLNFLQMIMQLVVVFDENRAGKLAMVKKLKRPSVTDINEVIADQKRRGVFDTQKVETIHCNFFMETRDIAANSVEKNDADRDLDKVLKEFHEDDATFNTNVINVEMLLNFTDYYKFHSRIVPIVFNILMINKDCFIKQHQTYNLILQASNSPTQA